MNKTRTLNAKAVDVQGTSLQDAMRRHRDVLVFATVKAGQGSGRSDTSY